LPNFWRKLEGNPMMPNASGRLPDSGISITLTIVGWLSIAVGCLAVIVWIVAESTAADGGSAMEFAAAIAGLISGILFIALGAIVQKLHEIGHHLRPAVKREALSTVGSENVLKGKI
jgi:hypothetical protein